jgi:hypothetical protein
MCGGGYLKVWFGTWQILVAVPAVEDTKASETKLKQILHDLRLAGAVDVVRSDDYEMKSWMNRSYGLSTSGARNEKPLTVGNKTAWETRLEKHWRAAMEHGNTFEDSETRISFFETCETRNEYRMPSNDDSLEDSKTGNHSPSYRKAVKDPLSATSRGSCTMKDVSELAGVSTATVSRFVNGSGYVSSEAGMKVWIAISRLRYRPNAYAAGLARMGRGVRKKSGIHSHALATDKDRIDSKPRY